MFKNRFYNKSHSIRSCCFVLILVVTVFCSFFFLFWLSSRWNWRTKRYLPVVLRGLRANPHRSHVSLYCSNSNIERYEFSHFMFMAWKAIQCLCAKRMQCFSFRYFVRFVLFWMQYTGKKQKHLVQSNEIEPLQKMKEWSTRKRKREEKNTITMAYIVLVLVFYKTRSSIRKFA